MDNDARERPKVSRRPGDDGSGDSRFLELLRAAVRQREWDALTLAKHLRVSRATAAVVLRGTTPPSAAFVARAAKLFGWDADRILKSREEPAHPHADERLMTADEVAAYLRVHRNFVYELVRYHEFPHVKLGTGPKARIRFIPSHVHEWLAGQRPGK